MNGPRRAGGPVEPAARPAGAAVRGRRAPAAGLVVTLLASACAAAVAQEPPTAPGPGASADSSRNGPPWLFPDRSLLPDLLAGTRDPAIRGQLVYAWTDPTRFGDGVSGEVAVGATLPLLLLAGSSAGDALVLGLEGAAFARFSFDVVERELVNTDWVFAMPLVWHRADHWLRLRYYHTSSHIGDEYARRFQEEGINFSRDAVDITAYARPVPSVGVYGLVQWWANVHPVHTRRWAFRSGIEIDPWRRRLWRPYVAADLQTEQESDWEPRVSAETGIWLPVIRDRPLRMAVQLVTGPSAMGQFHGRSARYLALGLIWNP